jgi:small ligand-binding sensory domain FIST
VGTRLAFCTRNAQAAKADLVRVCTELRDALEPEHAEPCLGGTCGDDTTPAARRIAGAVYVSCTGRGGPHFGAPSAELQIIKRALGDVPLVGFFAAGEIAHHRLYGYTGVLTVFVQDAPASA